MTINPTKDINIEHVIALARKTLSIEADAINLLEQRFINSAFSTNFIKATTYLLNCQGRVIVSGVGKSGHIARKLAATFSSTGTPAFFLHPTEASHGDLGMIIPQDVCLAISYSGATEELLNIIPIIKRTGVKFIAFTGNNNSQLAKLVDAHLDTSVTIEACPLNLAPTASTTAALALGDALAITVSNAKGFAPSDFAKSHPGGELGKKLLTYVSDVMRTGNAIPKVSIKASVIQAIFEMTAKRMGMTVIVDDNDSVKGIFTDGDLRRLLEQTSNVHEAKLSKFITSKPCTISPEKLAIEAVSLMQQRFITQLLVIDANRRLLGALNIHDLFSAKVV